MNEQKLIEAAQNGDRKALAELVKMYEQTVYNFSFKLCRNRERAEHTMQETFLSMVKNLRQFSGQSKLSTWLYRVVANHCLMLARSENRYGFSSFDDDETYIDEKEIAEWKVTPDKVTENNELKMILDESIQKLAPEYRVVFMLRDVEGLSTEETAKILDLSVPAVKSRLHRARAFLRNELNERFAHELK
ncbi:ECF subfamily RNA polymerase sigma-24 factor [Melioribacter roseus P3M-2]|uniref:ECF subfamily RNA polymerase sigma-24 factor n=1 Tax=Melioribacter roseus (strain DSM 23840 / JCM 17771 / VKM B-2668 / P3M-2) TaxID=1191523 RepID=I6ZY90_MELRP|nr:RNA polymerase sigma factor [Melioribacter roseus]AFN73983.1 ECF subfamily RNA polymerase sigma-24 factor [Melioribacter roseus P3M-2]